MSSLSSSSGQPVILLPLLWENQFKGSLIYLITSYFYLKFLNTINDNLYVPQNHRQTDEGSLFLLTPYFICSESYVLHLVDIDVLQLAMDK